MHCIIRVLNFIKNIIIMCGCKLAWLIDRLQAGLTSTQRTMIYVGYYQLFVLFVLLYNDEENAYK